MKNSKAFISCSIVVYNSNFAVLAKAIDSYLNTELPIKLYIIDNSPSDSLRHVLPKNDAIEYVFMNSNRGFGYAHNVGIRKAQEINSTYHLVLNPDVEFAKGTLENIAAYMSANQCVSMLMPKVLNPDGSIQYLAKLLPTPLDFLIRRFPLGILGNIWNDRFVLKSSGYNRIIEVPYLSGCFLFIRTSIFETVGLFDENFFLHFEDLDFTRRTYSKKKAIFYPHAEIIHNTEFKSMSDRNILRIYMLSFFYYFNKWGWIFDRERRIINRKTLEAIKLDLKS